MNTRSDAPNTAIRMTALPYHFKFHRIVLPVELLLKMRIAAFEPGKTSGPIQVTYAGSKQTELTLSGPHPGGASGAIQLLFSGEFSNWFDSNLEENDLFFLDMVPGTDGPDGLRFELPQKTQTHEESRDTYVKVAVRPDWTDNRGLLGYYNPITEQYHSTPCLQLLLEANKENKAAIVEKNAFPIPISWSLTR